jgi:hypothetical protein
MRGHRRPTPLGIFNLIEMLSNEISKSVIKDFVLGGNADFTILNSETKNELHIKVAKRKKLGKVQPGWWIYYGKEYVGFIKEDLTIGKPRVPLQKKVWEEARLKFNWFWKQVMGNTLPDNIHLLHNGTCCRCGKTLTDSLSIERGIGPTCFGKPSLFDHKLFDNATNG